jgi:hypothetical protein
LEIRNEKSQYAITREFQRLPQLQFKIQNEAAADAETITGDDFQAPANFEF